MFNRIFRKQKKTEYHCSQCGEVHDDWPALSFASPVHYHELNENEKESRASLNSDFCLVHNDEDTYRFIRVTLHQNVIGYSIDLDYGLWVSLSDESYKDYQDNFTNENHITVYFGWLCSNVPPYGNTLNIPVDVHTKVGDQRPMIIPHHNHDHPFVKDYHVGISREEAEKRIHAMMGD